MPYKINLTKAVIKITNLLHHLYAQLFHQERFQYKNIPTDTLQPFLTLNGRTLGNKTLCKIYLSFYLSLCTGRLFDMGLKAGKLLDPPLAEKKEKGNGKRFPPWGIQKREKRSFSPS